MNITDIITAKTLTLNELQQNKQIGYEKDGVISKIDPKYLPEGGSDVEVATNDDILFLLTKCQIVNPITDSTGFLYLDKDQKILTM